MSVIEQDWQRLTDYQQGVADRLGMRHLIWSVERDPPDSENHAEVVADGVFRRVHYSPDIFGQSPSFIRHVVCHEVCHEFTRGILDIVETALETLGVAGIPIKRAVRQIEDNAVDAIAAAVAPLMPRWDEGAKRK